MRRREFVALIGGALAWPCVLHAQSARRLARVGVLTASSADFSSENVNAFRRRLRELGWIEGQNLVLDLRFAEGRYERLPLLAAELVALKPDAIYASAAPSIQAVKEATSTIPIIFETLGDALHAGLVPDLARPGGNVTGVSGFAPELTAKRLQLVREILPEVMQIAVLANLDNPAAPEIARAAVAAGQRMQVRVQIVDVRAASELAGAFERMARQKYSAVVVVSDPMLFAQRRRTVDLAAAHRIPAVYELSVFAEEGGLLSYGPYILERYVKAADYVNRVLRGAKPGDLPVEQPAKFEMTVNLVAAKALGLTIPASVLLRADRVIE